MSSPSPSDPPSAPPHPQVKVDPDVGDGDGDGAGDAEDRKPDPSELFQDSNDARDIEKYRKYEADYTQRLMAKYFSKKTLYGGDIYDEEFTIDGGLVPDHMRTLLTVLRTRAAAARLQQLKQLWPSQMGSIH
ncbi:hypothetical protein EUGRSUZ_K02633 [Eucalyptus grandis]|uniref:Uncharacterized protein n=2 Tax=Eucalyptus grandis TaxID=71139 RepID=A0A059A5M1_EUCGR|nr:hypothetical protein EUGRSUZ_K02633 [Eucalyptus grandis]